MPILEIMPAAPSPSDLEKNTRLIAAGAAMTVANGVFVHPLDTIKVQSQKKNISFQQATRQSLGNGGCLNGIHNLYKGITPNISRQSTVMIWRAPLTANAHKSFATAFNLHDTQNSPTAVAMVGASFSISSPIDTGCCKILDSIKIKKQTGISYKRQFHALIDKGADSNAFRKTYFKGVSTTYFRNATAYASLLVVNKMEESIQPDAVQEYWAMPLTAAASAAVIAGINNPLDVIRTHVQSQGSGDAVTLTGTAKTLYKTHGVGIFGRGFLPRYVSGFLASGIGLVVIRMNEAYEDKL